MTADRLAETKQRLLDAVTTIKEYDARNKEIPCGEIDELNKERNRLVKKVTKYNSQLRV